jgi:putative phage-type endonuclease
VSLTREQRATRHLSIGSSDAAPAIGIETFGKNRITLWREKTGRSELENLDSRQIRRGNFLEGWIAKEFALERGVEVRRSPARAHPKYPWMTARPDFKIVGERALVECKSVSPFGMYSSAWGEEGSDQIPMYYLTQCIHQLIVTDLDVCYLAAMFADVMKTYTIRRDRELEEAIIEREADFWSYVERDEPPPPATVGEVLELYPTDDAQQITATDEIVKAWQELLGVRTEIDERETKKAALEAEIKVYLSERAELLSPQGLTLATWKATKSSGTDWKAAAFDLIERLARNAAAYTQVASDVAPLGRALLAEITQKHERPGVRKFLLKQQVNK